MDFFIDTFIQHILLSSYYVLVILLDTRHTSRKQDKIPFGGLHPSRADKQRNTFLVIRVDVDP